MSTTVRVQTADNMSYVGEIRGGFIEVGGVRAPAPSLIYAYLTSTPNNYGTFGHFRLLDGTELNVAPMDEKGILGILRAPRMDCSGEILIYVESLGKEVVVPANSVRSITQP